MQVIKKYANRKLYHTNKKQYITLDGIANLVQHGEAVQILDNETGEDITPSILAQVVLQSRGRSASPLPANVLTGLIQFGGDTLAGLRKTVFSSLGGTDIIEAEIGRRIDRLVADGSVTQAEAAHWRQLLLRSDMADDNALPADLPTRNDLTQLHKQVDALSAMVEQLLHHRSTGTNDKTD
jgi:polyhydroxyalkanoate synthesis repressor PhaR